MTQTAPPPTAAPTRGTDRRPAWPLLASAAGAAGFVATMVLDGRQPYVEGQTVEMTADLFESLDPVVYRASMLVGYVAVVLLLGKEGIEQLISRTIMQ